jgi:hypothetical protein
VVVTRAHPCAYTCPHVSPPDLCITADDYGLSASVNAAIESLANASRLTAVSVMGHRDANLSTAHRLADAGVAVGVHLCFTRERPLTRALGERLPGTYQQLFALALRRPSLSRALLAEAEAQIQKLETARLHVDFINAHEHVHLFPPLWLIVSELARRRGVRIVRAALGQRIEASRAGALALASRVSWTLSPLPGFTVLSPLGVGQAGALTLGAVDSLLARPFFNTPRVVRELCVHPGLDDPGRRAEYDLLASGELERLVERRGSKMLRTLSLPH